MRKDAQTFGEIYVHENNTAQARNDLSEQLLRGDKNPQSWSKKDITQGLIGIEYSGISDLIFTLEVLATKIENHATLDYAPNSETMLD